ncbi:hypothetical protein ACWEV9_06830 [Streptomyces albogriseolus]|uniref:hypothetical protein n=1 Tax=Streptomyces albogriseolus TaxID=1887 RepID=UPI00167ABF76|nr:hypothetical protein [Streptomyces viridodiastaticus]GHG36620.1 hypothetical protein GCM10018777_61640 [Streptomyces viridodiastaticus]
MEQRIGSSSSKPLEGAGFDPAFIPGLTAPATGREEDAKDTKDAPGTDGDGTVADAATEAAPEAEESEKPGDSPAAEAAEAVEAAEESEDDEPEPAPGGPVFEASDRRAALVADHRGVRLRLDDQECEFRWDEIGAVETETARFGKRYTVTVHTPDRRWYPLEIDADSRRRFAEWDAALDKVLDAYFDDGAEEPADRA